MSRSSRQWWGGIVRKGTAELQLMLAGVDMRSIVLVWTSLMSIVRMMVS
jgi:hypothetical protein